MMAKKKRPIKLLLHKSDIKQLFLFPFVFLKSVQFSSVAQSCLDSLWPHEPQHARSPCPSPTPRIHLNPCPLSRWCHPIILSSVVPFSSRLQSFPASGSFQMSALCSRWPKYWNFSFNISPSNEYSELISFRMDWLDLLDPTSVVSSAYLKDSQESSPTPQFKSINSLALSFLYSPTLTSIHDHWKNHSFDYTDLYWQSNVSAF